MEDLGAAVERIMADPAFSKMVKELGGGDGGDLMEKLPRVMETLGPMLGGSVHDGEKGEGPLCRVMICLYVCFISFIIYHLSFRARS